MSSYYEKILATGEVKCIDEEIPFEVPQGWEWERFGNVMINKDSERIPLSVAQRQHLKKTYDYYGASGVIDKVDKYLFDKDLLLIGEDGANLINRSTPIAFIAKGKYWVNNHAHVLDVCSGMALSYVALFINAISLVDYVTGTAQPKMNQEKMNSILLAIPPVKEQHRILEKMSKVDAFVDKYASLQTKLDSLDNSVYELLRKSILQEAIQGKLVPQIAKEGTAQELLEQIKVEKEKLVKEGKLKKSVLNDSVIFRGDDNKYYEQIGKKCLDITEQIPFEIPSNWEWCRVRNVSNSYIGLTYKPTDIDEKGTIVLRSCNIRNGKLALDNIVRVSSSISEKLLIEENDIIICARNGSKRLVGKSALIRNLSEPMTFGAFMAICKTPIYEYMFVYLQSDLFFGQLRDVSNTTTINQLTQNKFNDFLIPIPPIREQERIAFKISQLFQKLR